MSSDDSPGANDNGNTDLPTLSATNSDSNHDFFLGGPGGGSLLGEVSLPSKFLSAKNSIEVHRNKILPNNQSLPNVLKDRGNCLRSLTSTNYAGTAFPHVLRSIFSPVKGSSEDSSVRHSFGSKSSKTVNWAPILPGSNPNPQPDTTAMESIPSPRGSNANLELHGSEAEPPLTLGLSTNGFNNLNGKQEEGGLNDILNAGEADSGFESCPADRRDHDSFSPTVNTMISGPESETCIGISHGEDILRTTGPYCDSGVGQTLTLEQSSVSNYTLPGQQFEDKTSCPFVPPAPAENYVYNAQVRPNPCGEIKEEIESMTQNYPVARRDQNCGADLTNLSPGHQLKENSMDNHNYDTDDDLVEPDQQASLLTLVNPKDLPIPDADYVSRMVPEELHPFIAKKCKKDCRTWLWKSNSQRETLLAQQRLESEKNKTANPQDESKP